nr:MAG TPA: hypothetical protein [Caudoviricetes sp.]
MKSSYPTDCIFFTSFPFLKWWYISIIRSEEEKDNINTGKKGEKTWERRKQNA